MASRNIVPPKTTTAAPIPNQRENSISQLRQQLRILRSQFRKASDNKKEALAELRRVVRERLLTLRRAEWHRKRIKERAHKCSAFIANPFGFAKKLLGEKCSGQLSCRKEDIIHHLRNTHSNSMREQAHLNPLYC